MAATVSRNAMSQYVADTTSDLFIRDVPDWTQIYRRSDTPMLNAIGRATAPSRPMLKSEWGWSYLDPVQDQLAEALDNSETGVDVDNGSYFQVGSIIKVDDEHMRVTSISSNTLTVIRGFAGTTAASHNDDSKVEIISIAMTENADDPLSPITQGEVDFNYHSLFQMGWQFSQRAEATPTYESEGVGSNRFQIELKKKMEKTAPILLERTLLFGQRALGSTTTASSMGGLAQSSYVTTRSSLSSAPLTEYDLLNAINTVWTLVGDDIGKTIMTSMFGKRIINSWYNSSRRTTGGESRINLTFDEIETDMGTFKITPNYQFDATDGEKDNLYLLNFDDFKLRPYASNTGWQTGVRATDGPYKFGFLRGDFTMLCSKPDTRLQLHTWSTTATDYPGFA